MVVVVLVIVVLEVVVGTEVVVVVDGDVVVDGATVGVVTATVAGAGSSEPVHAAATRTTTTSKNARFARSTLSEVIALERVVFVTQPP